MDLDDVASELYTLLPADFTATRDAHARTARREGDRELASRISALRKPTLAAWAANLLVRTAPDETDRFLALGEELRRAYRDLDGDQLRELARTQRRLVAALSRQARDAAAEAGQPIGDGAQRKVEQTLQAVLADPEAAEQWSAGTITKPLTPPTGFTTTDLQAVPAEPRSAQAGTKPKKQPKQEAKPKERKPAGNADIAQLDKARERRRRREQEADEARRAADDAAEDARRAAAERDTADDDLAGAKDRRKAADERLAAARDALRDAEREQQAAADAEREARNRAQDASRSAREADRTARRATDRADRLAARRSVR